MLGDDGPATSRGPDQENPLLKPSSEAMSLRPPAKPVTALYVTFLWLALPALAMAQAEKKMNVAPNPSFEDDLSGIETNVCVFGGWFPIGVVTAFVGVPLFLVLLRRSLTA